MKKSTILSLLILLISFACQEQYESPGLSDESQVIYLKDNKQLQHLVNRFIAPHEGGRSNHVVNNIDFTEAIQTIDESKDLTCYSFHMDSRKRAVHRKFILTEDKYAQIAGYIYEYELDATWYNMLEQFPGWDHYNGYFRVINMDGLVLFENTIVDGKSVSSSRPNSRTEGYTCVTSIQQVGLVCVGGSCTPKYETITTCFPSGGSGGGSGNNFGTDDNISYPEYVFLELENDLDAPGTLDEVCPFGKNENGECIKEDWDLDQTFGKLCDNINFKHSANSFTAEIHGLGGSYINRTTSTMVNVELSVNCVDIPEYYIGTSHDAGVGFASVFNMSRTQVEMELESGLLEPNTVTIRSRLIAIIKTRLQAKFPGATFGLSGCQGNIPVTIADYGC